MNKEYMVLAPGPVHLHPQVQQLLSAQTIHHRTPEFDEIFNRSLKNLKYIFSTENDCYILTSTGSGGMECLLVNVLNPGDQVLCIDSGKFGERWAEMAEVFGGKAINYKVPWGQSADPEIVKKYLTENPQIKIVICQATETSTGAKHPIQKIGEIIKSHSDVLFLVDGITALGAYPLKMDEFHIDGLVGGSQKSFMLPTGLSFVSFSKKAWLKIDQSKTPRFYFDIRREKASNKKGESFFSSNVTLIRALDWVLTEFKNKTLESYFNDIKKRQQSAFAFAKGWGLSIYPEHPSESLTVIKTPENLDSQKIRTELEQKHQITIMGGQDQLKGKILRIGHMGYLPAELMIKMYNHLSDVLINADPKTFNKEQKSKVIAECQKILN
jgi:aspartate aminotransferase-like enzyme